MTKLVIGVGVGRTGTYSLKLALTELDLGPCYHMEEVLQNLATHVPLWQAAAQGKPDWAAIYSGYKSAVDWPTAGYFRELYTAYPKAKFVLTTRSPESWVASFSDTIYKLLAGRDQAPPPLRPLLEMSASVIEKTGFPAGMGPEQLSAAFLAHTAAVEETIPASQLVVLDVKDGWAPLCDFLGVSAPDKPFPRSNGREEFWERLNGKP